MADLIEFPAPEAPQPREEHLDMARVALDGASEDHILAAATSMTTEYQRALEIAAYLVEGSAGADLKRIAANIRDMK